MRIQAVLIDAENVSCTLAPSIMAEAKKQGMTTRPYVYGRKEALKGWQVAISTYSMQVRTKEAALKALYGPTLPPYLWAMLESLLEQTFHELCLEDQDVLAEGSRHRVPGQIADFLESLERDPVLGGILSQEEPAKQWKQVQLFAQRCDEAYKQGFEAAKTPFAALLVDTRSELFQQRRQKDAERWRAYSSYGMTIYPRGYSEETEREVMRRWYQRGYTAWGVQQEAKQRIGWN